MRADDSACSTTSRHAAQAEYPLFHRRQRQSRNATAAAELHCLGASYSGLSLSTMWTDKYFIGLSPTTLKASWGTSRLFTLVTPVGNGTCFPPGSRLFRHLPTDVQRLLHHVRFVPHSGTSGSRTTIYPASISQVAQTVCCISAVL